MFVHVNRLLASHKLIIWYLVFAQSQQHEAQVDKITICRALIAAQQKEGRALACSIVAGFTRPMRRQARCCIRLFAI